MDSFRTGGNREVDVVVAGLRPDIAAEMEDRFGARLRVQGDRVELRVTEKRVNSLLSEALAADAEIVSVTPLRASLESIFLSAVEDGTSGEGEA